MEPPSASLHFISKLNPVHIKGHLLFWIRQWLCNKQQTVVAMLRSCCQTVASGCGIPHRLSLSSLLFTSYKTDIDASIFVQPRSLQQVL